MGLTQYSKCHTKYERAAFIFAHISIFIVFVWFGFLKVIGTSPADTIVQELLEVTMPFWNFPSFFVFLGLFEMAIGILFVIPKMERVAITLLIPQMLATILPLFILPESTWQSFGVPTLTGQYIIKNVIIIALAVSILVDLKARRKHHKHQRPNN